MEIMALPSKEILELFNKIKDKLGYKVNDYILED